MRADTLLLLAAVVAVAGCASHPVYEGGRAWNEGWREGMVELVGTAPELGGRRSYDCRYRNGAEGRAQGRFAVVVFQNMGSTRHHVVPVESGKEPRVGASVLTNWRACEPPIARNLK